ncbi:alpha/beta fold hydrolase [uncultured Pseudokineococcus sp.]|uniref:alpha/beta fold hydrolase n=1 Tax=uncultured Pseudokineococcus sp. TaxID=1642928 RepID=UPI00260F03BF|nr:alpha/beta hydrolase [uncultured Pseudokineococcus sp.]
MAAAGVGTGSAVRRNHVTQQGVPEGSVVLLAHGFGADQSAWGEVVPALAEHHRVVLVDHVGAGRSDLSAYDREKYSTLEGYVDDLLEVCAELDLREVTLVAHSISAMMALMASLREPGRFARLVLVAPSPCYIDDPATGYVGGFSRADVEELLESLDANFWTWSSTIAPMVMGNPDRVELGERLTSSFRATDPDIAQHFAHVTFFSDVRGLLDRVTVPAVVLQCVDDVLAPPEVGDHLHAHLAGSTLVHLEASGHCPHQSAPEELVGAVLAALATAP